MPAPWNPLARLAALSLAAGLTLAVIGCGGKGEGTDDATVITEPGSTVGSMVPAATGPASTAPAPAASPSTVAKAEPATAPAAASSTTVAGFGTIKGQVVFDGDPPKFADLVEKGKAGKDPAICATKGAVPDQRLVVDPATKGVRYALVYIPKLPAGVVANPEAESEAKAKVHVFDQKNCVFEPHVIGMTKGSKVSMVNSDAAGHNVHSFLENATFNESVQPNATLPRDVKQVASRPGRVICDIHGWMSSWWMVVNTPYITVTDAQGRFELKNVPAGTQRVVVWTEASYPGFVTANAGDPVDVKAGGEVTATFHLKPEMVKIK